MTTSAGRRFQRLGPDQRKAEILDAATQAFGEQPYPSVSTADIARRAGVARGLVNHYFGTKRALYLEVVRQAAFVPRHAVEGLPDADVAQRIDAAVTWFVDSLQRGGRTWLDAAVTMGSGSDPDVEAILVEAENRTVDQVLEAVAIGTAVPHRETLRAVIRTYGNLARAAGREWLLRDTLSRDEVHLVLTTTLAAIVDEVVPSVLADRSAPPTAGHT